MIDQINEFSAGWGEAILRASWQGAVLALIAWVIGRVWKKMPPILSCGIWLIVFLKLAISVMPLALELPFLPAKAPINLVANPVQPTRGLIELSGMATPPAQLSVSSYLLAVWGLGVCLLLAIAFMALAKLRAKVKLADPLTDPDLLSLVANLSSQMGLRKVPPVVISNQESNAMTIGIAKPIILIPRSTLDTCSREEISFILAHELAHIKRGDAWLALLPQMVSALFFFHPAVWIANREFELSREAACDQIAVRTLGASQDAYGRLLLKLSSPGEDANPPFVFGISSHFRILSRRIFMLKESSTTSRRPLVALALAGVFVAVPWTLVSADPTPAVPLTVRETEPEPTTLPEPIQKPKAGKAQKPKAGLATLRRTQAFVVDLKYAKAENVKAEVLKRTKLKSVSLVTDSRKNQIVVVGYLPESEQVARLVRTLDKKPVEKVEPVNDQRPSLLYSTHDATAIALAEKIQSKLQQKFPKSSFTMTVSPNKDKMTVRGSEEVIAEIGKILASFEPNEIPPTAPKAEKFTGKLPVLFLNATDLGKKLVEQYEPKYNRKELRILVDPATNQLIIEAFAKGRLQAVTERGFALDQAARPKPNNSENMALRKFQLKVIDAERGFGKFREMLAKHPSIDFCSYDPTDNSLVVRADNDDMEAIGKSIEQIDRKGT